MHRYTITKGDNVRLDSVSTCPFSPRSTMTSVVWKNKIILFAGCEGRSRSYYNDVHVFNLSIFRHYKVRVNI